MGFREVRCNWAGLLFLNSRHLESSPMFDKISDSFGGLFRKLSGTDKISESNVADAMGDVRTALLDADVHLDVVNEFCENVLADAKGQKVHEKLEPGQQMIGIVNKRLVELLGGTVEVSDDDQRTGLPIPLPKPQAESVAIRKATSGPTIIMMAGLQGSGKTTTCGKLAGFLKKQGRSVLLAACDLQRPAAVEQLQTIATQVGEMPGGARVGFYGEADKTAEYGKAVGVAIDVAKRAVQHALTQGFDTVILDTAGRLHVNDQLMGELEQVKNATGPHEVLLVVDAMSGQDAVNSAKAFHNRLAVSGVILSKYDSDTRGGAAISVRKVTGAPIKFVGVGEKLGSLEEFLPDRVAGRILGMGDVVSLVEKAQREVSDDDAKSLQDKMMRGEMTMDDFIKQMKLIRRMGPLKQLLGLLPGVGNMLKQVDIDDKHLDRIEAIVGSMTKAERQNQVELSFSRRKRVASGAGVKQEEVNQLVKQFEMVGKVSKQLAGMNTRDRAAAMREMGPGATGELPKGMQGMGNSMFAKGSSHTASVKDKFKKRKR